MGTSSVKATPQGIELVNQAISQLGMNHKEISGKAGLKTCRAINSLMSGKPLDSKNFQSLCTALDLAWEKIAGIDTSNLQAQIEQIKNLIFQGDFYLSIEQLEQIKKDYPHHWDPLNLLAECYFHIDDIDSACKIYHHIQKLSSSNIYGFLYQGLQDLKEDNYNKAVTRFTQALEQNSESVAALLYRCQAFTALSQDQALVDWERVFDHYGRPSWLLITKAKIHMTKIDIQGAKDCLDSVITDPKTALWHRAEAYQQKALLQLYPRTPAEERGEPDEIRSQFSQAIDLFQQASAIYPNKFQPEISLCRRMLQNLENAIASAEEEIEENEKELAMAFMRWMETQAEDQGTALSIDHFFPDTDDAPQTFMARASNHFNTARNLIAAAELEIKRSIACTEKAITLCPYEYDDLEEEVSRMMFFFIGAETLKDGLKSATDELEEHLQHIEHRECREHYIQDSEDWLSDDYPEIFEIYQDLCGLETETGDETLGSSKSILIRSSIEEYASQESVILLIRAIEAYQTGDITAAVLEISRAIAADPGIILYEKGLVHLLKSSMLFHAEQYTNGINEAKAAAKLHQGHKAAAFFRELNAQAAKMLKDDGEVDRLELLSELEEELLEGLKFAHENRHYTTATWLASFANQIS